MSVIAKYYYKLIQNGKIDKVYIEQVRDEYGKEEVRNALATGLPKAIKSLEELIKSAPTEREILEEELREYKELLEKIKKGEEEIEYKGIKF